MLFNLEDRAINGYAFTFRPGVRLDLWLLYFRFAIPLTVNAGRDYGFLFGLGKSFGVGPVGVFVEADVNLTDRFGFGTPNIEFRGGVQFTF